MSAGAAWPVGLAVQGGHSPVCRFQPVEAGRLQSGRVGGHLPGSHVPEARVHRRLPHAGRCSAWYGLLQGLMDKINIFEGGKSVVEHF